MRKHRDNNILDNYTADQDWGNTESNLIDKHSELIYGSTLSTLFIYLFIKIRQTYSIHYTVLCSMITMIAKNLMVMIILLLGRGIRYVISMLGLSHVLSQTDYGWQCNTDLAGQSLKSSRIQYYFCPVWSLTEPIPQCLLVWGLHYSGPGRAITGGLGLFFTLL